MKITLVQPRLQWQHGAANIVHVEELMNRCPGSDVYVLPEMWATGFVAAPTAMTRMASAGALQWMQQQAQQRQCAIAGSLAVDETVDSSIRTSGWRNRLYFVTPQGGLSAYDKQHLFTLSEEPLSYVPGTRAVVVEWHGVRFRLQVCFDLRFPEAAAQSAAPYDVLLHVAAWPSVRQAERDILIRARAIENQALALSVNAVGPCGSLLCSGHSVAVDAHGHTLAEAGDEACCVTFEPDMEALCRLRRQFPLQ